MVLYGFCRVMAGVVLVCGSLFLLSMGLQAAAFCLLPLLLPFSRLHENGLFLLFLLLLPRSRVYARARFNDNNNNIIDIDNRYRYKVVLACFKLF